MRDLLDALPPMLRARPELKALAYALEVDDDAEARNAFLSAAAFNEARLVRLDAVLQEARVRGVRIVPYKGAALARSHYPDPGARPMTDVDLLCHPRDLVRAAEALCAAGLRRVEEEATRADADQAHDWKFVDGELVFELHYRLWHELEMDGDPAPFLTRARETLDDVDHLYVVLVHAATHGLTGNAAWIVDAILLAGDRPRAFEEALAIARTTGADVALLAGWDLLHAILPARVPAPPIAPAALRRRILRRMWPWLLRGEAALGPWGSRLARPLVVHDATALGRWAAGKARLQWSVSRKHLHDALGRARR